MSSDPAVPPPKTPDQILHRLRYVLRARKYSPRTEGAYVAWARRYLAYHRGRDVRSDPSGSVATFLDHLGAGQKLSGTTLHQAASALSFLYRHVLGAEEPLDVVRPGRRRKVPDVLSRAEVRLVLGHLGGRNRLIGHVLYGSGCRLSEALGLRVKDIAFDLGRITVREGKGGHDRVVPLAMSLVPPLRRQIERVERQHELDRLHGNGWAPLPHALDRKLPNAGATLAWQYVFPASRLSRSPGTGRLGRHPLHSTVMQRAMSSAARRSGIAKRVTCHTLRHSFATHLLMDGYDPRTVQELMGHKDLRTTMGYLHSADRLGVGVRSPLDALFDGERM